jgi:acyl-coenzyme A thioesterase PaaI-like protein
MTDDLTRNQTFEIPEGYSVLPWHRGFGRQVGPLFEKRNANGITRGFRVEDHHTNGMMNAHGGMLMTFADMTWGAAVEKNDDTWWVTVRLTCDFLSGAKFGSWVEGHGEVVGAEDGVYTVEGRIWSGDTLLMRGTGIFKVIERRG